MTPLLSLVVYMAIVTWASLLAASLIRTSGVRLSRHDARKSRRPSRTQSACWPCGSCCPKHGAQLHAFRCLSCRRA